jgi:hypothetical protein
VVPTPEEQPLLDLFEQCRDHFQEDLAPPESSTPPDPRLLSAFIHALPWIAEPTVQELHEHLVTLAAAPGEGLASDPSSTLVEKILQAAVIVHLRDLRDLMSNNFYIRQVQSPLQLASP